jgi:hypothetical protein
MKSIDCYNIIPNPKDPVKWGFNITQMGKVGRENSIFTDQDLFNAALMFSEIQCSAIGPDGMDFSGGGFLMSHAVGTVKPWKKQFVLSLLSTGLIPSRAETEFFRNLTSPIDLFPVSVRFFKVLDLKLAKLLGRVLGH